MRVLKGTESAVEQALWEKHNFEEKIEYRLQRINTYVEKINGIVSNELMSSEKKFLNFLLESILFFQDIFYKKEVKCYFQLLINGNVVDLEAMGLSNFLLSEPVEIFKKVYEDKVIVDAFDSIGIPIKFNQKMYGAIVFSSKNEIFLKTEIFAIYNIASFMALIFNNFEKTGLFNNLNLHFISHKLFALYKHKSYNIVRHSKEVKGGEFDEPCNNAKRTLRYIGG